MRMRPQPQLLLRISPNATAAARFFICYLLGLLTRQNPTCVAVWAHVESEDQKLYFPAVIVQ